MAKSIAKKPASKTNENIEKVANKKFTQKATPKKTASKKITTL